VTAGELLALLEPVFAEMLSPRERKGMHVWVERIDDAEPVLPIGSDERVDDRRAWVKWRIRGEDGGSGSLRPEEGPTEMLRAVQSDLQDFIAESKFAWGELRGPRDLA
jgi:hypothetical protein